MHTRTAIGQLTIENLVAHLPAVRWSPRYDAAPSGDIDAQGCRRLGRLPGAQGELSNGVSRAQCSMSSATSNHAIAADSCCVAHDALRPGPYKPTAAPGSELGAIPGSAAHRFALPRPQMI